MTEIKRLIKDSVAFQLYRWLLTVAFPALWQAFKGSVVFKLWVAFDKKVLHNKYVEYVMNPKYISEAWYASFFYNTMTRNIRSLGFVMPKSGLKYRSFYVGIFLMIVLLLPVSYTGDLYMFPLFMVLGITFASHFMLWRTGTIFVMVNYIMIIFLAILLFSVPLKAFSTLCYLLLAIDFFFLVSFSVRSLDELYQIFGFIYITLFALCAIAFLQEPGYSGVRSVFRDSTTFAEIIVILFPFALIYPLCTKSAKRKILCLGLLIFLTFTVVTATHSKAALIGFSIELLVVILLTDIRYLPLLLFLMPALSRTAIENILMMFKRSAVYGNFFENIFYAFRDFWQNGFGLSGNTFLDIYKSTALDAATGHAVLNIPYVDISPVYFNFLIDAGAIVMIGFLYYILRLAHSSFTSLFTAEKNQRPVFAAGLAMLVGVSVSSLFESTLLNPRPMIAYWGMLGLLRAVRIIKFGALNS